MTYADDLTAQLGRPPSMLILEDNERLALDLRDFLETEGWNVDNAFTVSEASMKLTQNVFDLVLADYFLPDDNVLPLFHEIRKRSPQTKILIMTGVREPDVPVQAFRHGAADFVYKPFTLEQLESQICQLLATRSVHTEVVDIHPEDRTLSPDSGMVGESRAIEKVRRLIATVADADVTVLITGESGTGKELVARDLHRQSSRKEHAFVAVNCAAIPENLLEDELFGHVPGAYTDARRLRIGKFEEADKGTLFLDEIGEMPLFLQVKLLRVLEDREIRKLGSSRGLQVNTRVIAATNADLRAKLNRGDFRADLYYRLNMVNIHVPPLRERRDDIPLLVNHFLKRACENFKLPNKTVSPSSLKRLMALEWPGNVRELRNLVEVAALLSGNQSSLRTEDFAELTEAAALTDEYSSSPHIVLPEEGIDLNEVLQDLEKDLISQSLQRTNGNKNLAAQLLSLKRTTLVAKLRRLDLPDPVPDECQD